MTAPALSPRERAACLWAEHFTKNTARENPEALNEVKRHFTDGEIVEMSLMSGKQGMMNRFMDSFGIPIEDEGEVAKIKKSVRGDHRKMKAYLQALIDNWPETFPEPNPDD